MIATERKIGLDLLRAIAILIVLEQHGRAIISSVFPRISYLGYTDGVDIFFVLSGFLIGGILIRNYKQNSIDIKLFLIRRWYRTLPNYYAAFLISLVIYFILNYPHRPDLKLLLQTGTFIQNYYPPFENFTFFSESWSLAIEEHFYLTFAVLLYLFARFSKSNNILKTILTFSLIAMISRFIVLMTHDIKNYELYNSFIRIVTPCRFDSLAVGVFFAYLKYHIPSFYNVKRNSMILFGLGLLLCISFDRTWLSMTELNNTKALSYSFLFSLGVGSVIPFVENIKIRNGLIHNSIHYIAKVSYSLYLYHNFIFAQPISNFVQSSDGKTKIYFYLLYWIFVFSISFFTYTFIEKRFLKLREEKYPETFSEL